MVLGRPGVSSDDEDDEPPPDLEVNEVQSNRDALGLLQSERFVFDHNLVRKALKIQSKTNDQVIAGLRIGIGPSAGAPSWLSVNGRAVRGVDFMSTVDRKVCRRSGTHISNLG
jgi:hypothetical protein